MEIWFIFAVLSAVVGGIGAFGNKIAAQRKYNSQLVLIVNALTSLAIFTPLALYFEDTSSLPLQLLVVAFVGGIVSSFSSLIKIQVLHYIDSAIFLPLFKVLGPLLVILIGIIFFGESFSVVEWIGLAASVCVPVLLVTKIEHARQNNLRFGLVLIGVCAIISAIATGLHKLATDISSTPLWIISLISLGILCSSSIQYFLKHRGLLTKSVQTQYSSGVLYIALLRTIFAGGGFFLTLQAFIYGGPLGIVYTINSLYILPPIILAIIFYNEHWNARKAFAIALSVVALALLK